MECVGLLDRTGYPAAHTQEHAWQVLTETVRPHHTIIADTGILQQWHLPSHWSLQRCPPAVLQLYIPYKANFTLSCPQTTS